MTTFYYLYANMPTDKGVLFYANPGVPGYTGWTTSARNAYKTDNALTAFRLSKKLGAQVGTLTLG